VPVPTLARRVYGYQDFYRRGGLAVRHGFTPEAYKDFPFRVLMVLRNEERRNNMAERLLQNDPPALTMGWLTTFSEIKADPLGAIWMRPLDYREITKGTQYDAIRPRTGAYRRDPAREAMVVEALKKLSLLSAGTNVRRVSMAVVCAKRFATLLAAQNNTSSYLFSITFRGFAPFPGSITPFSSSMSTRRAERAYPMPSLLCRNAVETFPAERARLSASP
jgi:hypothetical protein